MNSYTIYAPATGIKNLAINIIRISGNKSAELLEKLTLKKIPESRVLSLRKLYDPKTKKLLDFCLVVWMPGPKSYTGEDSFEIHCHGGNATIEKFFSVFNDIKYLRLAAEGEFTKRAIMNGKIDLIKAEAIKDVIYAQSDKQRDLAIKQLAGGVSIPLKKWKELILSIMAKLETTIDFSDEEDVPEKIAVEKKLKNLLKSFRSVLDNSGNTHLITEGIKLAIIGKANVGKSSIFNRITKEEKSIVTNIPGTTRDVIEARINLKGFNILLYDTAGLNKSKDIIEIEGIRRAKKIKKKADLVLEILDATEKTSSIVKKNTLVVFNKSDLLKKRTKLKKNQYYFSAKTGEGLGELLESITRIILKKTRRLEETDQLLTTLRQKKELEEAVFEIEHAIKEKRIEIKAEHLRVVNHKLARLLGIIDVEDVLENIFKDFCIGK